MDYTIQCTPHSPWIFDTIWISHIYNFWLSQGWMQVHRASDLTNSSKLQYFGNLNNIIIQTAEILIPKSWHNFLKYMSQKGSIDSQMPLPISGIEWKILFVTVLRSKIEGFVNSVPHPVFLRRQKNACILGAWRNIRCKNQLVFRFGISQRPGKLYF